MTSPSEVPPSLQTFSQMLRFFRLRAGFSQADLATRANLSPRTISDLERGVRRRAYLPTVHALSIALDLTPIERVSFASAVQRARTRISVESAQRPGMELPVFTSSFVGRDTEVASLVQWLQAPENRIVTVTGPPGAGKTRLVVETARELAGLRSVRPVYCALTPQASHEDVLACLTAVRAPSSQASGPALDLFVIDNLERLPQTGIDVGGILRRSSGLKVLATSRVPSFVEGEQELMLGPLSLPDSEAVGPEDTNAFEASPAVRLLIDRVAENEHASIAPEALDVADLMTVSRRLEGLPLAIEIVASHVDDEGAAKLPDLMDQVLDLAPAGTGVDAKTLRTTIGESYRLLTAEEQWAFRRLAFFAGEWTLDDAVDFLINASTRQRRKLTGRHVYGILHRIAQHSLIQWTIVPPGVRIRMLGLIREYAISLLEAGGERESARDTLVQCGVRLSEDALAGLRGPDMNLWLTHLSQREATIEGALRELGTLGDPETATTILWNIRELIGKGFYSAGGRWISELFLHSHLPAVSEGRLRVLAACQRCREGYTAAAWRHARRGLDLLKLRPWDRIEALRLLPAALLALVPEEPWEPPPGRRAA